MSARISHLQLLSTESLLWLGLVFRVTHHVPEAPAFSSASVPAPGHAGRSLTASWGTEVSRTIKPSVITEKWHLEATPAGKLRASPRPLCCALHKHTVESTPAQKSLKSIQTKEGVLISILKTGS